MNYLNRNVWILMLAGALALSIGPLIVFVGGIVGAALATDPSLSTLPVAAMIVGTACSVVPVTKLMAKFNRKRVFIGGSVYGAVMAMLAAIAVSYESFWGFTLSASGLGVCLAIVAQFRFAAMECVPHNQASTAASIVLVGGLIAAFVGPEIAHIGQDLLGEKFVGSFVLLAVVQLAAALTLIPYADSTKQEVVTAQTTLRPLKEIAAQRVFWVAVLAGAIGYAVMSYVMTATPVSMHHMNGHSLSETKWVIQSHILAMYLPSFFSGYLIDRFGARKIMLTGLLVYAVCITIALTGQTLIHYWISLIALGLGWNFLFVSGTSLLAQAHTPDERFKVQGANDFIIFGLQALTALFSGIIVFDYGWNMLVSSAVPLLLVLLMAMTWEHNETSRLNNAN